MGFEVKLGIGARHRAGLTPDVAGPIVDADSRERGDLGLDQGPVGGEVTEANFHYYYYGGARAAAEKVDLVAAHRDEFAGWGVEFVCVSRTPDKKNGQLVTPIARNAVCRPSG